MAPLRILSEADVDLITASFGTKQIVRSLGDIIFIVTRLGKVTELLRRLL
jgi:hypothetical protein